MNKSLLPKKFSLSRQLIRNYPSLSANKNQTRVEIILEVKEELLPSCIQSAQVHVCMFNDNLSLSVSCHQSGRWMIAPTLELGLKSLSPEKTSVTEQDLFNALLYDGNDMYDEEYDVARIVNLKGIYAHYIHEFKVLVEVINQAYASFYIEKKYLPFDTGRIEWSEQEVYLKPVEFCGLSEFLLNKAEADIYGNHGLVASKAALEILSKVSITDEITTIIDKGEIRVVTVSEQRGFMNPLMSFDRIANKWRDKHMEDQ